MSAATWLLLAALTAAGEPANPPEAIAPIGVILKNRDRANGRYFCVAGLPTVTENKVGRVTGKHIFRGQLDDGTGKLEFFAFGRFPAMKAGERVEMCGRFHKFKLHRHGVGFSNELVVEVMLKGANIGAGLVELKPDGVRYRGKPKP